MSGPSKIVSASFTRPANTTAYADGDLVANSTTAGSVVLLSWDFGQDAGVWLRGLRASKSDPDITNASFRLWLTSDAAVTFSNGDNGALAIGSSSLAISDVLSVVDFDFDYTLTGSGDVGLATFDPGLVYLPRNTYGFVSARAAYTPASAEVFTFNLRVDPYP